MVIKIELQYVGALNCSITQNLGSVLYLLPNNSPWEPDARIFTLSEYYSNAKIEEVNSGIHAINNESSILQITTAYDTDSKNRLIVDGLKRCLAILNQIKTNGEFRPITILECYGNLIPKIFFVEFPHILIEK